jgi:hypothetical protein
MDLKVLSSEMVQFKGFLKGELARRFFANSVLSPPWENPYRLCSAILLGMQLLTGSVADPECLSRISDPDFIHPGSRIPDPTTATNGRGNLLSYIFCSHKYHKIKIILFLDW